MQKVTDLSLNAYSFETSMTKQLFIHLGIHKTGSTALQFFFAKNRERLKTMGICYPRSKYSHIAHHNMGWSYDLETWAVENKIINQLRSPVEEWMDLIGDSREYGKVLLSSETLSSAKSHVVHQIKELLSAHHVKLVIYLRRQDDMASSVLNEVIKDGTWRSIDLLRVPYNLNYLELVNRWAASFGKENVLIRPYESRQFYENNIFSDFMYYTFGIHPLDGFIIPEGNPRPRLSRDALEYKRLINNLLLSRDDVNKFTDPLIEFSIKKQEMMIDKKNHLLSPKERMELLARFSEGNAKIAEFYLGRRDRQLFYDPLPDLNQEWAPCGGMTSDAVVEISCFLKEKHMGVFLLLNKAVSESLHSLSQEVRQAAHMLEPGFADLLSTNQSVENS